MLWTVREDGFRNEDIIKNGNKFMTGNGYMGYRGTLEEFGKTELAACNLANLYDRQGDKWREPVNAPNGLYTTIFVNGSEVALHKTVPLQHEQILELREGLHKRNTVWDVERNMIRVKSERFVSMKNAHLICMKYSVSVEKSCDLTIMTGIDSDVWDINGPHLENRTLEDGAGFIRAAARTQELKIPLVVSEVCTRSFDAEVRIEKTDSGIFRFIRIKAEPKVEYTIYKHVTVYTGNDDTKNIKETCAAAALKTASLGYDIAKAAHVNEWQIRWEASDVIIEGNDGDQLALRYSIYQLLIIAPMHSRGQSIPARGLSGQTYKGAIFWDTEMFMLPFFLHIAPEVARTLIEYRINTLDGARRKAAEYGFRGAFYAWESQETGDDACSDFNVTDVFTGRPVKTYFRDKQVHISADVAYAIWEVYKFTGDIDVLISGGAEVILECARFFYSYAYYKEDKGRYEILDVIGPDEYHERVNNNAFTNKLVYHTIDIALQTLEILKRDNPNIYKKLLQKLNYDKEVENIAQLKNKLYVVQPDEKTFIIEQFDGYGKLEDCSLEEVRSRLLDPKEYWGGGHGVASNTKIIKQADVVFMLYLFRDEYSDNIKKANWTYYESRTEHGSSLSPCIYSLLSCDIGNEEWAYPFFVKSANIDLTGESKQFAGTIYIGGTHPAANGGAWMSAVLGFAGLKVKDGNVTISPKLPKQWTRMAFNIFIRGERYRIDITADSQEIIKVG